MWYAFVSVWYTSPGLFLARTSSDLEESCAMNSEISNFLFLSLNGDANESFIRTRLSLQALL